MDILELEVYIQWQLYNILMNGCLGFYNTELMIRTPVSPLSPTSHPHT